MFLKKEKDPTSKQFDDDEWVRSPTEAQEVTTDIPEDSVTFEQQEIMRQIGVGSPGGAEALPIFHQLLCNEWMTGSLSGPLAQNQSRREKWFWDDRVAGSARGGVAVSPQAPRTVARAAEKRGLADPWYIMCHPILVPSFLQEFDVANAEVGAAWNPQKTEGINNANDLDSAPPEWRIHDVQSMAKVSTVTTGSIALGVAVGLGKHIADQLLGKADVIRPMRERVQLCQGPQTEFALFRESLGVSRINQILRFLGHTILQEQRATEI